MRLNGLKRALIGSTCLGTLAIAVPAMAQENAAAEEAEEGTIFVTARKREEDLIDVPLPVTVATAEQIERDQIYNLNDLQRIAPALEVSQTFGGDQNGGARMRGIGTGVFNPSVSPSVALVVDQVPIGNLAFPQLFDLAQVEVLRGPQGTLFGQGASGGVLNISTRAPELGALGVNARLDFADKGTAGSEVGELIANLGFNLPLGDIAALRLATQYKEETGLQRSVTTGENVVVEDFGVRARLLVEPSDLLTINLSGEYSKSTSDGHIFFALSQLPDSTRPFGPPGGTLGAIATGAYAACGHTVVTPRAEFFCEDAPSSIDTEVAAVSAAIDLELSDSLSLTSVTGLRDRTFDQAHRNFSRLVGPPEAQQNRQRENSSSFSQELRLNYIGEIVDIVAGGYYYNFSFDRVPMGTPLTFGSNLPGERIGFSVCNQTGGFCPVGSQFTDENTDNRTLAAFADVTFQLTEQVNLFGGLRYDDYHNQTIVQLFPAIPGNPASGDGVARTFITNDSNVSGRVGVSFQPTPDANIFASYSRGYKPPAVGTNPAGQLFQLDPEKANAFELGARFNVGAVQLSGNAFYTELNDFQSQTSVFVGTALISQPLNIDRLESYGFELGAVGELLPGLTVNAGYQFNHITYPTGFLGDDGLPLEGEQFLNAPRHKFTVSGDFSQPLSDTIELFANANVIYKSGVLLAARTSDDFRFPSHETVNGGLGLRDPDGAWNASLFVRNLTKTREPTSLLSSTFAGQIDGGVRAWPVAGLTARVVGVRVGFEF